MLAESSPAPPAILVVPASAGAGGPPFDARSVANASGTGYASTFARAGFKTVAR